MIDLHAIYEKRVGEKIKKFSLLIKYDFFQLNDLIFLVNEPEIITFRHI